MSDDDPEDEENTLHIVHISQRRGRPRISTDNQLRPFSVRLTQRDVERLYSRWHTEQSGGDTRTPFSSWIRSQLTGRR